jgi:hypothetical protein
MHGTVGARYETVRQIGQIPRNPRAVQSTVREVAQPITQSPAAVANRARRPFFEHRFRI